MIAQLGEAIQLQKAAPTKGKAKAAPRTLSLCTQAFPELAALDDPDERLQAEMQLVTDLVSAFREHSQVRCCLWLRRDCGRCPFVVLIAAMPVCKLAHGAGTTANLPAALHNLRATS